MIERFLRWLLKRLKPPEQPKRPKVPNQVLFRYTDEHGNLHVIHRGEPGPYKKGWPYIQEGHYGQPVSWRKANPGYFFPITQEEIAELYEKDGREWLWEDEEW